MVLAARLGSITTVAGATVGEAAVTITLFALAIRHCINLPLSRQLLALRPVILVLPLTWLAGWAVSGATAGDPDLYRLALQRLPPSAFNSAYWRSSPREPPERHQGHLPHARAGTQTGGPAPMTGAGRSSRWGRRPSWVLLAGWFSLEGMGATAGDLMAQDRRRRVAQWRGPELRHGPRRPIRRWSGLAPGRPPGYSHLVCVCGPFYSRRKVVESLPNSLAAALDLVDPLLRGPLGRFRPSELEVLIRRFSHARFIGLDVSMLGSPDSWHPSTCSWSETGGAEPT